MAKANLKLVDALRKAAKNLENGAPYQWGHMGACNCGNLAQVITKLSKAEIHAYAMQSYGDWTEQSAEFCSTSGMHIDLIISEMTSVGLDIQDIANLERLSDKTVLACLPFEQRNLIHNRREDVILYMRTWADLLEKELLSKVDSVNLEELTVSYSVV